MLFYEDVETLMKNLHGQYIWIIGASSGIGAATARTLSQAGANIILSARRESELDEVRKSLVGANHQVLGFDVSDITETQQAFKTIKRLDRVLFFAAIYDPTEKGRSDTAFIHKSLQVNIGGVYNLLNVVLPFFEAQGYGQINLCGSVAGYFGLPNSQPYASTKAAIRNLAESLYVEYQGKNIDIKLISPGFVRTPMTDKNNFEMPMMIEVEEAAQYIAKGITSSNFEIHFPKKFTWIVKLLRLMPYCLSFRLSKRLR
ncbi:MAG TPA: SDR family NAD(P)-dependent oxidoreductase [Methylophilaceae bacterium]|nr:SDR family NAD(P)-dependent oxidoreductase [Methylophilaceae bacterium]